MKAINIAKPMPWTMFSYSAGTRRREMSSISTKKMRPPSSAGNGNKLKMPMLTVNNPINSSVKYVGDCGVDGAEGPLEEEAGGCEPERPCTSRPTAPPKKTENA